MGKLESEKTYFVFRMEIWKKEFKKKINTESIKGSKKKENWITKVQRNKIEIPREWLRKIKRDRESEREREDIFF